MKIEELKNDKEIKNALLLAFETIDENAKDSFKKLVTNETFLSKLSFYGAYIDDELVGMIATQEGVHISLLFVKKNQQRKQIGSSLYEMACKHNFDGYFTVNASISAVKFYERLGFKIVSHLKEEHGLKYYEMKNDKIR